MEDTVLAPEDTCESMSPRALLSWARLKRPCGKRNSPVVTVQ